MEQSPLSFLVFDAAGYAVFANPAWEKLWGARRGDLVGYNLFQDEQAETSGALPLMRRAFAGEAVETPPILYEARMNGNHGLSRWTVSSIYPVRDAAGKVSHVVAMHKDVTERVEAEEAARGELRHQALEGTDRLEENARELEMLSRSMSQDLRAPARHIGSFVELLRAKAAPVLDAEGLRYLDIISGSVKRLDGLISDLVAFSSTGQRELRKVPCNMGALVAQCVRDQKLAISGKGRNIAWTIGEMPGVSADPVLMREAWEHLIGNAVKFTQGVREARIEIGSEPGLPDARERVYFIRDNGAGFDAKYADKLFGLFQRLHTATEFPGTGIGLATLRRIIHRHRGWVRAEGEPGKGAAFYFSLPA